MLNRRALLQTAATGGVLAAIAGAFALRGSTAASNGKFEVTKSAEQWRRILTPQQFYVLREHGTERAGTSPLDHEKRKGTYHCAGCDLPVYSSAAKYDSGTGWPSFWKPLPNAIGTSADNTLFATRTEVHCRRCGGHLGHVFEDGPAPTGLRYCMNGVAMTFKPAAA
jgi:peptide-methionine (R)-S-oxide reductase